MDDGRRAVRKAIIKLKNAEANIKNVDMLAKFLLSAQKHTKAAIDTLTELKDVMQVCA